MRLLKKCVGGKVRSVRGKKLACHHPFDTPDRLGIPALEYDEEKVEELSCKLVQSSGG